jgi:hypothetical protein
MKMNISCIFGTLVKKIQSHTPQDLVENLSMTQNVYIFNGMPIFFLSHDSLVVNFLNLKRPN